MQTTAVKKRKAPLIVMALKQHVTLEKINDYVTLVEMPDLVTFDFHVMGDHRYIAHFLNPQYFGKEFAALGEGHNLFTGKKDEKTECYLYDDTQLRNLAAGVEGPRVEAFMSSPNRPPRDVTVCTGPIIIPPKKL